jgi:hypothetical protein
MYTILFVETKSRAGGWEKRGMRVELNVYTGT